MKRYPESLICKIYAVFTIKFDDLAVEQTIIVMENLAKISSKHIMCTYDLKGSTYDRQVLKNTTKYEINRSTWVSK